MNWTYGNDEKRKFMDFMELVVFICNWWIRTTAATSQKNNLIFKQVWIQPQSQPLDLAWEQGGSGGDGSTGDFSDIYKYLQTHINIYKYLQMASQVTFKVIYKSDFWFNRLPSGSNMGRMVLTWTWRLELGTNRSENISQQVLSFSSHQKIVLKKLHHFYLVRKYLSKSFIIFNRSENISPFLVLSSSSSRLLV